jgi:uncharacterized protein YegP (UPF0339 family)
VIASVVGWTVLGSAALALRAPAAPAAGTDDKVRAKFEVYKDRAGEFRWRLRATNSQVMAMSPDSYKAKRDCLNAIESVKRDVANAPVEDVSDGQGQGQHDGQAEKGRGASEPKRGAGSGSAK